MGELLKVIKLDNRVVVRQMNALRNLDWFHSLFLLQGYTWKVCKEAVYMESDFDHENCLLLSVKFINTVETMHMSPFLSRLGPACDTFLLFLLTLGTRLDAENQGMARCV